MSEIVIVGGGVVGMGLGMMLAHDGHSVTNLERDADPIPETADEAWERWQRTGVNQFRLPHLFLARFREILERELPEVAAALERDGALRLNPMTSAPDAFTGGHRDGDGRYEMLSGRRAMVERSVASVAERTPGLTIRRGVAVDGLTAVDLGRQPRVTGVRTADGEILSAELVVDCSGRRSALPAWLESLGVRRPEETLEDSGFIYFGRHFRSRTGELPVSLAGALQEFGSISALTLPADNGCWSVTLVARSGDRTLLGLRDIDRWARVVRSLPTVAHWIDADPVEDRIVTIAKIEDRQRDLYPDGEPVINGIVAVGDAWACTNPSVGRGASIGLIHAQLLRDTLREVEVGQHLLFSQAFAATTNATVDPWYRSTLAFDRHRLAEMAADAEGTDYNPGDPSYEMSKGLASASAKDADVFRAFLDVAGVLELPEVALSRSGVFEKVLDLGADWRNDPILGPNRDELVAMATA